MTEPVLHVITRLTMGGSSENTLSSLAALARAGYDCTLAVSVAESDPGMAEQAGRRFRVVDVPPLRREIGPGRDVAALAALWRMMARARPVLVHTHTSKAGFLGRLAARLARVPLVIHQPHGHIFYGYYSAPRTRLFVRLERLAARWTDRIVTLTERGTEEHLARRIGRREQYFVVPSGVPTTEIRTRAIEPVAARARLGLDRDAFVIAGAGRLVHVKGFDLLVAALPRVLAAVPHATLLLIGDGPERAELLALAGRLGVAGQLLITGVTSEVPACLSAADLLAAPSRNEGMGRVLVEALALGLPVVGAAVGGIPAVLAGGECGCLVPPDDVDSLAQAVIGLARDPFRRRKLAEAARHHAERFSSQVMNDRLVALYRSLLEGRR